MNKTIIEQGICSNNSINQLKEENKALKEENRRLRILNKNLHSRVFDLIADVTKYKVQVNSLTNQQREKDDH